MQSFFFISFFSSFPDADTVKPHSQGSGSTPWERARNRWQNEIPPNLVETASERIYYLQAKYNVFQINLKK